MKPSSFASPFLRKKKRPLLALQVEVTSRCTRSCLPCPRSDLARDWREGDLEVDFWDAIEPGLHLAYHVHLQGWGEPLLHPMLPVWAAKASEAGCTVGITTNGDLLDEASSWLLEGNVDLVTVSAAGAPETHASLCGGSKLEQALNAAGSLASRSRELGNRMKFQMSYLLTRDNSTDLPEAVDLAARAGLDEVFIIHLDCITSESLYKQAAYNDDTLFPGVDAVLKAAEKTARRRGIRFRGPAREGEEALACSLNPLYFAFVSRDGRVGPCVNLLLPLAGQIPRWSKKRGTLLEPVSYGRLDRALLPDLLACSTRELFTVPFRKRLAAEKRFLSAMDIEPSIRALREIDSAADERKKALDASPLPLSCAGCPKSRGW